MSTRLYWPGKPREPKPSRPEPPPVSPERLAEVMRGVHLHKTAGAAAHGLECCPKCGGTKAVYPAKAYRRYYYVRCGDCRFRTRNIYGVEDNKRHWNKIDRTHLQRATP